MNPASHLLIAAPCYFTFLLSFSSSLLQEEEKVSSFRSILSISLHAISIQRSVDFVFFSPFSRPVAEKCRRF